MFLSGKRFFAFLALFVFAVFAFPTAGFCDTAPPPSLDGKAVDQQGASIPETKVNGLMADSDIQKCHDTLVKDHASVAHELITYGTGLFNSVNVRAQYCWDQIQQMFSFAGSIGDPLNLVFSAVESMIAQQVMNIANELCSAALSVADQLKSFALSQFNRLCIPLPSFGIGGINLGLQGPPCNGTQLLPLGQMFQTTRPPGYDPSKALPQMQGGHMPCSMVSDDPNCDPSK